MKIVGAEFPGASAESLTVLRTTLVRELAAAGADGGQGQRDAALALMLSILGPPLDSSRRLRRRDVAEHANGSILGVRRHGDVFVGLPTGGSKPFRHFLRGIDSTDPSGLLFPAKLGARIPIGRDTSRRILISLCDRLGIPFDPSVWSPSRPRHARSARCAGRQLRDQSEEAPANLRSIPLFSGQEYRLHSAGDIMLSGAAPKDFLIFAGPTDAPVRA